MSTDEPQKCYRVAWKRAGTHVMSLARREPTDPR